MNDLDYILGLVKTALGITGTTRDDELKQWIEWAIDYISNYTHRPIRSEDIVEVLNWGKNSNIIKYPTDAITKVEYRVDYTRTEETIVSWSILMDYRNPYFIDRTTLGVKNLRLSYTTGRTLQTDPVPPLTEATIGTLPNDLYTVIVNYVVAVDKLNSSWIIDGVKSEKLADYSITFKTSSEMSSGNILLSSSDKTILDTYVLYNLV